MTGCLGFYDLVGKVLVENSGFNQWAETNNVRWQKRKTCPTTPSCIANTPSVRL
jgi:hypothetical protein